MKEPAKNRLVAEVLVVIDWTRELASERPTNGAADQELALTSHIATEGPGEVKLPPTQTLLFWASQKTASICPFGPFEPSEASEFEEDV